MLHVAPYNRPPTYQHRRWTTHQSISYTFSILRLCLCHLLCSFNKYLQQVLNIPKFIKIGKILVEQSCSLHFQFLVYLLALPCEILPILPTPAVLQSSSKPPTTRNSSHFGAPREFYLYFTLAFTLYWNAIYTCLIIYLSCMDLWICMCVCVRMWLEQILTLTQISLQIINSTRT